MLEAQNRIELTKVQLQQQQLELECYCLDLIRDGKLAVSGGGERDLAFRKFDVVGNMKLIPKFDEKDVGISFYFSNVLRILEIGQMRSAHLCCNLFLQVEPKKRILLCC